jgi:hypothetical protein
LIVLILMLIGAGVAGYFILTGGLDITKLL